MARTAPLHLKVTTDTTDAVELAPRVKDAVLQALTAADLVDRVLFDSDALAGSAAVAVMAEIIRIRQATPAESAQARAIERVRKLHKRNENTEECEYCSARDYPTYAVPFPCDTVRALDGEEQPGA